MAPELFCLVYFQPVFMLMYSRVVDVNILVIEDFLSVRFRDHTHIPKPVHYANQKFFIKWTEYLKEHKANKRRENQRGADSLFDSAGCVKVVLKCN